MSFAKLIIRNSVCGPIKSSPWAKISAFIGHGNVQGCHVKEYYPMHDNLETCTGNTKKREWIRTPHTIVKKNIYNIKIVLTS